MPVRKRRKKRTQAAGLDEWSCAFESEFDLFGDLDGLVQTDAHGRPSRQDAEDAWQRFGGAFLAEFETRGGHFVPWALREFGEPR